MKKRMLLLPLLSGLVLSGCTFTLFGQEITLGKKESKGGSGTQIPDTPTVTPKDIPLMEEYGNYKLADSITAGKRYLLGLKRLTGEAHVNEVRFFNGNYHVATEEDGAKAGHRYSYYLGTNKAENGNLEFAAELEAEASDVEGEFYFKVHTTESNPWNNKYLALYTAKAISRNTISFIPLDSVTQTSATAIDDDKNPASYEVTPTGGFITKFKMFTSYEDDRPCKAPGFMLKYTAAGDTEPVAKFFGSSGDYVSIDCQTYETALDPDNYDLAHLYEAKVAA